MRGDGRGVDEETREKQRIFSLPGRWENIAQTFW